MNFISLFLLVFLFSCEDKKTEIVDNSQNIAVAKQLAKESVHFTLKNMLVNISEFSNIHSKNYRADYDYYINKYELLERKKEEAEYLLDTISTHAFSLYNNKGDSYKFKNDLESNGSFSKLTQDEIDFFNDWEESGVYLEKKQFFEASMKEIKEFLDYCGEENKSIRHPNTNQYSQNIIELAGTFKNEYCSEYSPVLSELFIKNKLIKYRVNVHVIEFTNFFPDHISDTLEIDSSTFYQFITLLKIEFYTQEILLEKNNSKDLITFLEDYEIKRNLLIDLYSLHEDFVLFISPTINNIIDEEIYKNGKKEEDVLLDYYFVQLMTIFSHDLNMAKKSILLNESEAASWIETLHIETYEYLSQKFVETTNFKYEETYIKNFNDFISKLK